MAELSAESRIGYISMGPSALGSITNISVLVFKVGIMCNDVHYADQ